VPAANDLARLRYRTDCRSTVAALILLAALVTVLVVVLWADLGKLLPNF